MPRKTLSKNVFQNFWKTQVGGGKRTRSQTSGLVAAHAKTMDYIDNTSIYELLLKTYSIVYRWDNPEKLKTQKEALQRCPSFQIFMDIIKDYKIALEIREIDTNIVSNVRYNILPTITATLPATSCNASSDTSVLVPKEKLKTMGLYNTQTIIKINEREICRISIDTFKNRIECTEYMNKLFDVLQIAIAMQQCNSTLFDQATLYLYVFSIINQTFNPVKFVEAVIYIGKTASKQNANDLLGLFAAVSTSSKAQAQAQAQVQVQAQQNAPLNNANMNTYRRDNIDQCLRDAIESCCNASTKNNGSNSRRNVRVSCDPPEEVLKKLKRQNPEAFGNVLDDVQEQLKKLELDEQNADTLAHMLGNQLQLAQNKDYINVFEKVFNQNRKVIDALNEYYKNMGLAPASGGAKVAPKTQKRKA